MREVSHWICFPITYPPFAEISLSTSRGHWLHFDGWPDPEFDTANHSLTNLKQSSLKQHWNWSQYSLADPKQSKFPSAFWTLRINSVFDNPKVFFSPRAFAFALTSCIFISTPTASKLLERQELYVIFFSDFSRLSRTSWILQMIKCSRAVGKPASYTESHVGLVLASNKIKLLADPEPSLGWQPMTFSTPCSYLNKSLFGPILL